MSYQTKYTSIELVEALTQMSLTESTDPTRTEVFNWIEEVEKEIDARKLGWKDGGSEGDGYDAVNVYIDVPERSAKEEVAISQKERTEGVRIVYPQRYVPIISVTSLYRRKSLLTETPEWEELKQGYYEGWTETSDTDWMPIIEEGKCGQKHIIGFLFYGKKPDYGPARLKGTWKYGYNIPGKILQEYATLKVAVRVLEAAVAAGEPTRVGTYTGGDFQSFVNVELRNQINEWKERIKEIERLYFPDDQKAGSVVIP